MKKTLQLLLLSMTVAIGARAQVAESSAYNASSTAYDFSNAETVVNDADGVGYVANNSGAFYHFGPAAATLTVNGLYNAYNPAVAASANNGNTAFTGTPATPGIDYFQGLNGNMASDQEIAGTVAPRFGILKLDNGTLNQINLTNSNGAEIGLRTDFSNGITTTVRSNSSTGALKFLAGSSYTNTALGDAQYVNGYVSKAGNTAFTFPVGDQNGTDLRTLAIAAPATAADQLSVAYWKGDVGTALDPTGGAHSRSSLSSAGITGLSQLASVSPIGFWDFVPVAGTDPLTITISIPNFSGTGGYAVPATMRVVGWNTTTSQWDNLSGATGPASNTEGTTMTGTVTNMASYSAIAVGNVLVAPLPVKLTAFSASLDEHCRATLTWKTATEQNVRAFVPEYATDGATFTGFGEVACRNSATGGAYSYSFDGVQPGSGYFRLKIVFDGGDYIYSTTAPVHADCNAAQITIAPNPATTSATVRGLSAGMTATVMTPLGQLLGRYTASGAMLTLSLDGLPAGIYTILIRSADGRVAATQKLSKL